MVYTTTLNQLPINTGKEENNSLEFFLPLSLYSNPEGSPYLAMKILKTCYVYALGQYLITIALLKHPAPTKGEGIVGHHKP